MKRLIPRAHLLAFARECLKLEKLLSEADDLADLARILKLVRAIEKSGGTVALEALLRPEQACPAGLPATWNPAGASSAKETAPPLSNAQAGARRQL